MKEFFKRNFEFINLMFVTMLFTLSCVHYIFTIFSVVYLFFVCLFLKSEQIIKIQIVLRMFFESILVLDTKYLELVFVWFVVMYFKNWLIDLIYRKQKMNLKLLTVICSMLILNLFAPIYKTQMLNWFIDLSKLLTLYFLYEKRNELKFVSLVRVFCYSLIASFVLGYIIGGRAEIVFLDANIKRYCSLFFHPNVLSDFSLMACIMLFAMAYYKKMSVIEYSMLLLVNFILGYLTISRNFVLLFVIIFIIFSCIYIIKYKWDGLLEILKFAAIFLSVCLLFKDQTDMYFRRVVNSFEKEGLKQTLGAGSESEWWGWVFEGKVLFDPGRLGLWKLYLMRIFKTPFSALFGYGVSAPFIGKMHPHNIVLFEIYQTGIVGFVLSIIASAFILNWKELKNYKKYLGIFVVVLGYFGDMFINGNNFAFIMVAVIISGCMFVKNGVQTQKEKAQFEREKMLKRLER